MTKPKEPRPSTASCIWCGNEFTPLNFRQKFCSSKCSSAFRDRKPGRHFIGPCPICGKHFHSRYCEKIFCSMTCYVQSDQFKTMQMENIKKIAPEAGTPRICKGCSAEYSRSRKAKFCSNQCRRKYFAERFDRWIANPESVALPQNFDEFLNRSILTCPVDGCDWEGQCLSVHANASHGIAAREFKKLCGFNLTTGLIGTDLSAQFAEKTKKFIEEGIFRTGFDPDRRVVKPERYSSLEAKEHAAKSRADTPAMKNEFSPCLECGIDVQQPSSGRKLYCSTRCRSRYYAKKDGSECTCGYCGERFWGKKDQAKRFADGLPVTCSTNCRNRLNIVAALASRVILNERLTPPDAERDAEALTANSLAETPILAENDVR